MSVNTNRKNFHCLVRQVQVVIRREVSSLASVVMLRLVGVSIGVSSAEELN
jgi:hypothetical protein